MSESKNQDYEYSTIVTVAKKLRASFDDLHISVTNIEIEKLSCFFNNVYGTRNRAFHDIFHALNVSDGCSGLGVLAGFFHDVVYVQIDRGRLPELREHFGIFTVTEKLELTIPSETTLTAEPWANSLVTIFGFSPNQTLGIFTGLNEFLSAWVATQMLHKYLTKEQIIHVVACIEATIPFRGEMINPTVSERLRENVKKALRDNHCTVSEEGLTHTIKESVKISNNDIKGFGMEKPDFFIHNSWALLYESNPALQNGYFSIVKYREPLQRLDAFFGGLNPQKIFTHFAGSPNKEEMAKLSEVATNNLRVGRAYIQAKLLDTAILEAFALISGGDCPLELFTGPKPRRRESKTARIEQFLDWENVTTLNSVKDENVIRLLNDGRAFRSKFDVKTALFAAYIYLALSPEQFALAYSSACKFFKREITPEEFLTSIPDEHIYHIGDVISHIAWTRTDAILKYLENRKPQERKSA